MKPKIVILRGMVACGKTTALYRLKKNKKMKGWIFIDNSSLKAQFENLGVEQRREFGKKALFSILKNIIPLKKNILMDEMSEKTLRKGINYSIKKYDYNIITFQFIAKLNSSIKREAYRRKLRGLKPRGPEWVKKYHNFHEEAFDPEGIVVDCDLLDEKKVERYILKKLKI